MQLRAVTSEEGAGPWSDIGQGQANRPPGAAGQALPAHTGAVNTVGSLSTASYFTDPDSDALTYMVTSEYPGLVQMGAAPGATVSWSYLNSGRSQITITAQDGYGGAFSGSFTATASPPAWTRAVAENAAAGTLVGNPVTGTPYNGETLTYTLTGEASTSGAFEIDSATGQIKVKQGASLDYETKSSYTGQVEYTVQGQAAFANVTINVTDVEPGQPGTPTVARTKFSAPTNPALDVTWTAPASGVPPTGYEAQYRKKAAQG